MRILKTIFSFVFTQLTTARDFLLKWNELWLVTALLIAWPVVQIALYVLDPTARVLDAGVLSIAYLAFIIFASFNALIWLGMKFNMPVLYEYFENRFEQDFKNLHRWEQVKYSLLFFLAFFALAVFTLIAVAMTAG